MTDKDFQKKMLEKFKERLPSFEKELKGVKFETPQINYPFFMDGVIDSFTWDVKKQKVIVL